MVKIKTKKSAPKVSIYILTALLMSFASVPFCDAHTAISIKSTSFYKKSIHITHIIQAIARKALCSINLHIKPIIGTLAGCATVFGAITISLPSDDSPRPEEDNPPRHENNDPRPDDESEQEENNPPRHEEEEEHEKEDDDDDDEKQNDHQRILAEKDAQIRALNDRLAIREAQIREEQIKEENKEEEEKKAEDALFNQESIRLEIQQDQEDLARSLAHSHHQDPISVVLWLIGGKVILQIISPSPEQPRQQKLMPAPPAPPPPILPALPDSWKSVKEALKAKKANHDVDGEDKEQGEKEQGQPRIPHNALQDAIADKIKGGVKLRSANERVLNPPPAQEEPEFRRRPLRRVDNPQGAAHEGRPQGRQVNGQAVCAKVDAKKQYPNHPPKSTFRPKSFSLASAQARPNAEIPLAGGAVTPTNSNKPKEAPSGEFLAHCINSFASRLTPSNLNYSDDDDNDSDFSD